MKVLSSIFISCAFVCSLLAQSLTSLSGTVTDPSGAVIPNASLTLTNMGSGSQRQAVSDSNGRYSFPQVQPATYKLSGTAAGFSDTTVYNIPLLVNTPATIEVKFERMGATTTEIAVTADVVQINTSDASLGNSMGSKPITQLPFEGRNVVGLLSIQPGVVYLGEPDPGQATDYRSGAVNGGKSDQGNVTLDGVDVNDQQNRNAFSSVLRVTLDSVQEFRTITTNAGADFGRSSGAQVTLVTKSGSNVMHGSAYEFLRNTATSSNTFFNNKAGVPVEKLNRNVFGVSVGGPVKKNRLFYFLNYEGRRDASEKGAVRIVPNDTFRQGLFNYVKLDNTLGQLNPAQVRALDPGGIGASPEVLKVLQGYPHPNDTTVGDGINTSGFRFNAKAPLTFNTYIAKFDYQIDQKGNHQIFWRGNLQNDDFTDPSTGLPQFPGQSAAREVLDNSKGYAIGYTSILSTNLISTTRYGYTRQGTQRTGIQTSAAVSFRDIDDPYAITKGLTSIIPVHQVSEDLAYTKGSHSFTFGAVARIIRNNRLNFGNSFSDILINSSFLLGSGGEFVAADAKNTTGYKRQFSNLLGLLTQRRGRFNYDTKGNPYPEGTGVKRVFGDEEYEFYAQDSWKALHNFTITAGLRVSLAPPIYEVNGFQTSANVSLEDWYNQRGALAAQGMPQSLAPKISYNLASAPGGRPLYPYQHNVAPRIALAYSPDAGGGLSKMLFGGPGKTSIRAGFGMFYDLFGQGLIRVADASSLGFSTSLTNPANARPATVPRYTGVYGVSSAILPTPPKGGFPQTQPDIFQITDGIDDKLKSPYTMNMNFSIQRELGQGFMIQGAYVGRLSRRSLIRDDLAMPTNLKDPVSGATYFDAARQLAVLVNAKTPVASVGKIPYWENLWPAAAGGGLTATQAIYQVYRDQSPDYTTALDLIDGGDGDCDPACSKFGPQAIFNGQYSSLAAFRSRGTGNYHGLQLSARKRFSQGVLFDLNYTYSKSIDLSSTRETATSAISGQLINSWFPNLQRSVSDYDVQHVFSMLFVAELPLGRNKRFLGQTNRAMDAVIGGWQVSGVFRNTSGFPVGVSNGGVWPTNWEVGSYAIQTGPVPATHTTKNAPGVGATPGPNIFADPKTAITGYSSSLPGDVGQRNGLRGDGYFGIDLGLGKRFTLFSIKDQPHTLQIRAEAFNVTNSVRFDVNTMNINILNPTKFGQYVDVLTRPRVFQFSMRYEF
ncbi:MAG: carboxypeptidase-like regulatory domain-containing protein [Bryobacteraceae bacterium]